MCLDLLARGGCWRRSLSCRVWSAWVVLVHAPSLALEHTGSTTIKHRHSQQVEGDAFSLEHFDNDAGEGLWAVEYGVLGHAPSLPLEHARGTTIKHRHSQQVKGDAFSLEHLVNDAGEGLWAVHRCLWSTLGAIPSSTNTLSK